MNDELLALLFDRGRPLFWVTAAAIAVLVALGVGRLVWRLHQRRLAVSRGQTPVMAVARRALRAYRTVAQEAPAGPASAPQGPAAPHRVAAVAAPSLQTLLDRLQRAASRLEDLASDPMPADPERSSPDKSHLKAGLVGVDYLFRGGD